MDIKEQNIANQYLSHHNAEEERKKSLFSWIGWFLLVDATCFIGLLLCAFEIVKTNSEAWHLFAAPALAGGIGAIVAIFTLKAVYNVKDKSTLPTYDTVKELAEDLSQ